MVIREPLLSTESRAFPAAIKVNLGIAFAKVGGDADNVSQALAISNFQDALTIYTEREFPREYRETMNRLADSYYRAGEWQQASYAYTRANFRRRSDSDIGARLFVAPPDTAGNTRGL